MYKYVLLLFLTGCANLFFFPSKKLFFTPSQFNLVHKEIILNSANGNRIVGWLLPTKKPPKSTIVFFHGNAENISTHFLNLAWAVKHGHQVFLADYQGYGKSEGSPSPKHAYEDTLAILEKAYALHLFHKSDKFIVYGQSLGGNIVLNSLVNFKFQKNIDLLVIDSSFLSYKELGFAKLASNWLTFILSPLAYVLLSDEYAPINKVNRLGSIPTLVIHGNNDQVVPFKFGKEIYNKTKAPKWFWEIEKGRHTDIFFAHDRKFREKFLNFIRNEKI